MWQWGEDQALVPRLPLISSHSSPSSTTYMRTLMSSHVETAACMFKLQPLWPSNCISSYIHERIKNTCPHKNVYTNVHSNTIHNNQKVETTHMPINWWLDKQNVVCPYNEISFSYRKKWSTDLCYNVDEPWKHAKSKRPVTKECIFYDPIYIKYPE